MSKLGAGPSMPTREELEEFFKDEVEEKSIEISDLEKSLMLDSKENKSS